MSTFLRTIEIRCPTCRRAHGSRHKRFRCECGTRFDVTIGHHPPRVPFVATRRLRDHEVSLLLSALPLGCCFYDAEEALTHVIGPRRAADYLRDWRPPPDGVPITIETELRALARAGLA